MTPAPPLPQFRDFTAPRGHGTALIDPPLSELAERIAANRALAASWDLEIGERPLAALRQAARAELVQSATRYTSAYRETSAIAEVGRRAIVMAGHQPELFHPGVWFKNFALSAVAANQDAIAINLIVDNDLCGASAISAPSLRDGRLVREAVSLDAPAQLSVPFEQRWIGDRAAFDSFDRRLAETLRGVVDKPAVMQLWGHARRAADRCQNIGCSVAQARHALEGELGLQTLELPISVACRTYSFSAFVLSLIADLPRLHSCYNQSLIEYRQSHGIRSSAHPVPELAEEDGWFEAPLWIYGDDDPRRRSAWVRLHRDRLEISDRETRCVAISGPAESAAAAEQLFAAAGPRFKLRPRALVTTMYARLVLSDMFLHGIGGAKYDQLGDMIIQRFFGIQPPEYGVLSATVLLPPLRNAGWERGHGAKGSVRELQQQLRDLRFSPERFADRVALPASLVARKQALLNSIPPLDSKAAWHREIEAINHELSGYLSRLHDKLAEQLQAAREAARETQIARSREHPFPVHPLEWMVEHFERLLKQG